MTEPQKVDVFISGAGPVGLVLAYQLARLGISTFIIDAANKASPDFPMYGRACSMQPGTLEIFDRLELFNDLAQEAHITHRSWTYQNGERVHRSPYSIFDDVEGKTRFPFAMNLRLKYSEDIFRAKLAGLGTQVHAPVKLLDFVSDEKAEDDYKITASCDGSNGEKFQVKARYIVGADGGGSTVRKLAGIPFVGEHKDQHWVRIDGIIKTNIPDARAGFGSFESRTYGPVLFVALDHGATRIGYVLTAELFQKYGMEMTKEQAVVEAKLAVAPFELEFEEVHWHTVYGIQQRVAETFVDRGRIILAGDAAHTHSSGAAQGMNTGMHDVSNLSWRLAGVIKHWYKPEVLQNYSEERRAIAQQLIEMDKTISQLIYGLKPKGFENRPEEPSVLLREYFKSVSGFLSGFISYPANLLNDVTHAIPEIAILPGFRSEDVPLRKPGIGPTVTSTRLHELTRFDGKFKILVFAGRPMLTRERLQILRKQVDEHDGRIAVAAEFLTIIAGSFEGAIDECLGVRKFGKGYFDGDYSAHWRYGVSEARGALIVLRPDGILGVSAPLDGFVDTVIPYSERLLMSGLAKEPLLHNVNAGIGELKIANESSLESGKPVNGIKA